MGGPYISSKMFNPAVQPCQLAIIDNATSPPQAIEASLLTSHQRASVTLSSEYLALST